MPTRRCSRGDATAFSRRHLRPSPRGVEQDCNFVAAAAVARRRALPRWPVEASVPAGVAAGALVAVLITLLRRARPAPFSALEAAEPSVIAATNSESAFRVDVSIAAAAAVVAAGWLAAARESIVVGGAISPNEKKISARGVSPAPSSAGPNLRRLLCQRATSVAVAHGLHFVPPTLMLFPRFSVWLP